MVMMIENNDKLTNRYWVEITSPDGILRKVVVSGKALIQSFSVDAKRIMFEMRVDDLKSFNKMQKLIGIRPTDMTQTLWTDEIAKIDLWFDDADNLMFFINEYARHHAAPLGTRLNVQVWKAKPDDFDRITIDYPIDRYKFDFDNMQPRTIANQNLCWFQHSFYDYIEHLYRTEIKQVDWKTLKYSLNIAENLAYKLMELSYLDEDFQVTNKFFDEFTNGAYNDNERNYKEAIRNITKMLKNKKLLVRDKAIIAQMLFDIGVEKELIDPITSQLTDKALEYIECKKQGIDV